MSMLAATGSSRKQPMEINPVWGLPRYYRQIRQGDRLVEDPDRIEHPNLGAAWAEAFDCVRDLLKESIRHWSDCRAYRPPFRARRISATSRPGRTGFRSASSSGCRALTFSGISPPL